MSNTKKPETLDQKIAPTYIDPTQYGAAVGSQITSAINGLNDPNAPETVRRIDWETQTDLSNVGRMDLDYAQHDVQSTLMQQGSYFGESQYDDPDATYNEHSVLQDENALADNRAFNQSGLDQFSNSLVKTGVLTITSGLDVFVGAIVGIGGLLGAGINALTSDENGDGVFGRTSDLLNSTSQNPISRWLHNVNKTLDEEYLVNYRTSWEKSAEWYQRLGTMNFWGEDLLKNMGFTFGTIGAMMAGGAALKALQLGAFGTMVGIQALQAGAALAESGVEAMDTYDETYQSQLQLLQQDRDSRIAELRNSRDQAMNKELSDLAWQVHSAKETITVDGKTVPTKEYYAAKRAEIINRYNDLREGDNETIDSYIKDYEKGVEYAKNRSKLAANTDYGLNIVITYATNALGLGKILNRGMKKMTNVDNIAIRTARESKLQAEDKFFNDEISKVRGIGKEARHARSQIREAHEARVKSIYADESLDPAYGIANAEAVNTSFSKLHPTLNTAKHYAEGQIFEGGQELLQSITSTASNRSYTEDVQNYINSRYDDSARDITAKGASALLKEGVKAFKEFGWVEEALIGAITGGFLPVHVGKGHGLKGWVLSPQANIIADKEADETRDLIADRINKALSNDKYKDLMNTIVSIHSASNAKNEAYRRADTFDFKTAEQKELMSILSLFDKVGKLDDLSTMIEASLNTSDNNLQLIEEANKATDKDGNTISTFTKADGSLMTRDEIKSDIEAKRNNLLRTVEEYKNTKEDIYKETEGRLNDSALDELTWMKMNSLGWKTRASELLKQNEDHLKTLVSTHTTNKDDYRAISNATDDVTLTSNRKRVTTEIDKLKTAATETREALETTIKNQNTKIAELEMKAKKAFSQGEEGEGIMLARQVHQLNKEKSEFAELLEARKAREEQLNSLLTELTDSNDNESVRKAASYLSDNESRLANVAQKILGYSNIDTSKDGELDRKLDEYRKLTESIDYRIDSSDLIDDFIREGSLEDKKANEYMTNLKDANKNLAMSYMYETTIEDFKKNPSKLVEYRLKAEAAEYERLLEKEKEKFKARIESVKTIQELKQLLEDTPLVEEFLDDYKENELVKEYKSLNSTYKVLLDILPKVAPVEELADTVKLLHNAYVHAESKEELLDPDNKYYKDETIFYGPTISLDEAEYKQQAASNNIAQAIATFGVINNFSVASPASPNTANATPTIYAAHEENTTLGSATFDEVYAENKEANNSIILPDTNRKGKTPAKGLIPAIPKFHIEASKDDDFRRMDVVAAERNSGDFSDIYQKLIDDGAFDFVDQGGIKVGSKITFTIDPAFEEKTKDKAWHKEPTIFMVDAESGKIVGVLMSSDKAGDYVGLKTLRDAIVREYNESGKNTVTVTKRGDINKADRDAQVLGLLENTYLSARKNFSQLHSLMTNTLAAQYNPKVVNKVYQTYVTLLALAQTEDEKKIVLGIKDKVRNYLSNSTQDNIKNAVLPDEVSKPDGKVGTVKRNDDSTISSIEVDGEVIDINDSTRITTDKYLDEDQCYVIDSEVSLSDPNKKLATKIVVGTKSLEAIDKIERFAFSKPVTVRQVMSGKVPMSKVEHEIRKIHDIEKDGLPPMVVINNGVAKVSQGIDTKNIIGYEHIRTSNSHIYVLVPTASGKYFPVSTRLKRFGESTTSLKNPEFAQSAIGTRISNAIHKLAQARSAKEFVDARDALQNILYSQHVHITFNDGKYGKAITIRTDVLDSKGKVLMTNTHKKQESQNGTTSTKGTKKQRTQTFYFQRMPAKMYVVHGENGVTLNVPYNELVHRAQEGKTEEIKKEAEEILQELNSQREQIPEEETYNGIVNALEAAGMTIQLDGRSLAEDNFSSIEKDLIESGIMTTNASALKSQGAWFVTDYMDDSGNIQEAERINTIRRIPKQKANNKSNVRVTIKTKTAKGGSEFYVNLTNLDPKDPVVTDAAGNVYHRKDQETGVVDLIVELAKAAVHPMYSLATNTADQVDGKIILKDDKGRYLNKGIHRLEGRWLSQEEVKDTIAKLEARNKSMTPVQQAIQTLLDNQKNVDRSQNNDGHFEFYRVLEEDGQYHEYTRVHNYIDAVKGGPQYTFDILNGISQKSSITELKAKLASIIKSENSNITKDENKGDYDRLNTLADSWDKNKEDRAKILAEIRRILDEHSTFTENSTFAGNVIDALGRKFFEAWNEGKTVVVDNPNGSKSIRLASDVIDAFWDEFGSNFGRRDNKDPRECFTAAISNLHLIIDTMGLKPGDMVLTSNIVLYHKYIDANGNEQRIAGEVDALVVRNYASGNPIVDILDFKTSKSSKSGPKFSGDFFEKPKEGTSTRSYREQYTAQLSIYKSLLESEYGISASGLALVPFEYQLYHNGDTRNISFVLDNNHNGYREGKIDLTYDGNILPIDPNGKKLPKTTVVTPRNPTGNTIIYSNNPSSNKAIITSIEWMESWVETVGTDYHNAANDKVIVQAIQAAYFLKKKHYDEVKANNPTAANLIDNILGTYSDTNTAGNYCYSNNYIGQSLKKMRESFGMLDKAIFKVFDENGKGVELDKLPQDANGIVTDVNYPFIARVVQTPQGLEWYPPVNAVKGFSITVKMNATSISVPKPGTTKGASRQYSLEDIIAYLNSTSEKMGAITTEAEQVYNSEFQEERIKEEALSLDDAGNSKLLQRAFELLQDKDSGKRILGYLMFDTLYKLNLTDLKYTEGDIIKNQHTLGDKKGPMWGLKDNVGEEFNGYINTYFPGADSPLSRFDMWVNLYNENQEDHTKMEFIEDPSLPDEMLLIEVIDPRIEVKVVGEDQYLSGGSVRLRHGTNKNDLEGSKQAILDVALRHMSQENWIPPTSSTPVAPQAGNTLAINNPPIAQQPTNPSTTSFAPSQDDSTSTKQSGVTLRTNSSSVPFRLSDSNDDNKANPADTTDNTKKELKWLERVLPNFTRLERVEILKDLKHLTGQGFDAWGAFVNGTMYLSSYAAPGTVYHEAFHTVFRHLATEEEKVKLLEEAEEKYGKPDMEAIEAEVDRKIKNGSLSSEEREAMIKRMRDLDLEEKLAEAFRVYTQVTEDFKIMQASGKTRGFFRRLWNWIKILLDKKNGLYINNFFRRINEGEFANKNLTKLEMKTILEKAPRDSEGRLLAPNGKPSNLTEKQYAQVRTKAFRDWFGDWENNPSKASKAVDENGEPLVVYHRTDNENLNGFSTDFDNYFSQHKGGTKKAIFFTGTKTPKSGTVLQRNATKAVFLNIRDAVVKHGTKDELRASGEGFVATINNSSVNHDGVIFHGMDDNQEINQDIYVIHNPNNVKSAIDNNEDFSTENNDIRYRKAYNRPATKRAFKESMSRYLDELADDMEDEVRGDIDNWYNNKEAFRNKALKRYGRLSDALHYHLDEGSFEEVWNPETQEYESRWVYDDYLDQMYDNYSKAIGRHSDYRGNLKYHVGSGNAVIYEPFSNDSSALIGQLHGDSLFVSHFAPTSLRQGVKLIEQALNDDMPIVFAVPEYLSKQLRKAGYRYITDIPQVFNGEVVTKHVMVNKAVTDKDLLDYMLAFSNDNYRKMPTNEASYFNRSYNVNNMSLEVRKELLELQEEGFDIETNDSRRSFEEDEFEKVREILDDAKSRFNSQPAHIQEMLRRKGFTPEDFDSESKEMREYHLDCVSF